MKKLLLYFMLAASFMACEQTTQTIEGDFTAAILPQPKSISSVKQGLVLSESSKIYTANEKLGDLADLFQTDLHKLTGHKMERAISADQDADIVFAIDASMPEDEYQLKVDSKIELKGGSYQAVAMGKNSLLQLVQTKGDELIFPVLAISDSPDATYRGLMIDLARKWHDVNSIKELIDLAAFYKLNYVQLHFTDYQSYTLPSTKYPKLSTPDRHYSFEDLKDLEAYAQVRGISIIPEIDIPGHSSPFVKMYPKIFAIQDTASNPWIINMGKEEVYTALDTIIGEIAAIFQASPYFHIGGDEAIFNQVDQDPAVQTYMAKHDLGTDVHELYRHFLVRMNEIVKSHQKQMCVWEGFRKEGTVEIPKDIIVFEFETNRYLPDMLVKDGYTVVNTSWKPLYVVNQKKWEPKTIYAWNMWRWENWWPNAPSFEPIQLEKSSQIIGAQMCAWEQAQVVELPSLRKRVPVFLERIWNTEEKISYEELMSRMNETDKRLSLLIGNDAQDSLLLDHNFIKPEE
ncbi:MAG: family 20 glycosylhydrolase [Bacteroidia bacterium]